MHSSVMAGIVTHNLFIETCFRGGSTFGRSMSTFFLGSAESEALRQVSGSRDAPCLLRRCASTLNGYRSLDQSTRLSRKGSVRRSKKSDR